jgi:hypothetical protein
MDERHWQRHSYLGVLRPEAGWRVDYAVLTTYSADLIACVAALMALAGVEEDEDSATKVDFANAYEAMRGRLRILIQQGRLARPARRPPILSILDQFIYEVASDETHGSWHPKIALVKFVGPEGRVKWHRWLGSRNLTRSTSWEAGLALAGRPDSDGVRLPGITELGLALARYAGLKGFPAETIAHELEPVRWSVPADTRVDDICLFPATMRPYPPTPQGIDELIVVSPFLDVSTLRYFGGWGDHRTKRTLVSLQSELATVYGRAAELLNGWQLLHLAPPEPQGVEATPAAKHHVPGDVIDNVSNEGEPVNTDETTSWEDGVLEPLGLHAKIIYTRHGEQRTLWLGSANATGRGWRGPNVEIVARLTISKAIAAGLETFVREIARTVDQETLALLASESSVDENEERLERARMQVVACWSVQQQRSNGDYLLKADAPPHPNDPEVELAVGLLGGNIVSWPRETVQLLLPGKSAIESELVQVQLQHKDLRTVWLQRAPLDPPPDEERDRRALARHLDPRTFLLWIRSLLDSGGLGDGGGHWYAVPTQQHIKRNSFGWWAPTLEELLRSWSYRPDSLREVDSKVQQYLSYIRADGVHGTSAEELQLVEEFAATWHTVRQVLVGKVDE